MSQIEKNKAELWKDIKKIAEMPLNRNSAATLVNYVAVYDALCKVSHHLMDSQEETMEESAELHFNRKMAEEWAAALENADGTKGPHFSMEKAKELMTQFSVDCDAILFWVVLNAVYSDDVLVAKKHNVNTAEYYVDMAKAWINDKDAVKDKATAYYTYIVRH